MDDSTMTTTPTETPEVAAMRQRLHRAANRGHQNYGAYLDQLPTSKPCERHDQHIAVLNREKSLLESRPIYTCAACVAATRVLRYQAAQQAAGVPPDVRHASTVNFHQERPCVDTRFKTPASFVREVKRFLERESMVLILGGSTGIGKGHLAASVANFRLAHGYSVAWIRADDLFALVHSTYRQRNERLVKADIIEEYSKPALLVLDEVALNNLPADGEDILFGIIDHRYQAGLQIIMTTNQPYPRLEAWFGDRVWSRLHARTATPPVYVYGHWADWRKEQAETRQSAEGGALGA